MTKPDQTILLIDDDPYDTRLIVRAMKKARILDPVQSVNNGEEAIQYLSGDPPFDDFDEFPAPVLMLLDIKMPRKDGFDVLNWLQARTTLRRLPVVVLTSSDDSSDINRAYDLGANSFLVKPVGTDALVDMLETVELYWLMTNTKPDTHP